MQMCVDSVASPKKRDWFVQAGGIMAQLVLIADYYLARLDYLPWTIWNIPFELFCFLMVLLAIGKTKPNE